VTRYIIRRIFASIFVLLVIITVSLWITRQAPSNPCLKERQVNTCACLKTHHLDRPVFPVYIPPPTDPVDGCQFWKADSVATVGPVHMLGPSEWGETQFAHYMGMLMPELHLESSPEVGMFGDHPPPDDHQTPMRLAPVDLGGDIVGWVLRVGGGAVNFGELVLSGIASIPSSGSEPPDVYIGSEHLFNWGEAASGLAAGPGIRIDASLGPSMKTDRLVLDGILAGLPFTLQLGIQAILLALLIGVPAGMYAGLRQNTMADYSTMTFAMVGIAVPNFVLGPILILIFALGLGWFRAGGWATFADSILPTVTLSLYYAAYIARLTRGGMLEMIRKDFVRTARAKGLTEKTIVFRHTLKGTLLPVVSYLGPAFAALLTGSVVVEKIFSIPGLGTRFVESALNRDYNMVLGTVIVYSTFLVTLNLLVDIVYTWLDPRVSYDEA